eukprot:GHUV01012691.1.p1 GENE.GHUV01012691.1~~GHUV01012691.1.p1  ORF type:complete len:375 (+),score=87.03 GHUV01012691.1:204-1328(+)
MDTVELDRLEVLVMVDNESDGLSLPCYAADPSASGRERAAKYTSEISHLVSEVRSGHKECADFRSICGAGHGLSLLLTAEVDGKTHTLLFDGGPSPELFEHNARSLEVNAADIQAAVLSHWHIDHSAGLPKAAQMISEAKAAAAAAAEPSKHAAQDSSKTGPADTAESTCGPPVVFDLHPKRPIRRGIQPSADTIIPFNKEPEFSEMEWPSTKVECHSEGHTLQDGCFYVSGFIPRVTSYETGNPNHVSLWEEGGDYVLDEEVADERYVAAAVKGKGVIVFSACSHAGIVNVMKDVQQKTGKPPYAVFGGFHLAPRDTATRIEATVADMVKMEPSLVVAGHCTGWRARYALCSAFKDKFMPSFVGSRFSFSPAT